MNNTMKISYKIALPLFALIITAVACVEKFDTPPENVPFETGTIISISQLKALYDDELQKDWFDRTPVEITGDLAITGIVTGSDKKDGNLYKEGYIEDASSGILLKFESTGGFYLGDSVIINVNGLYLGDYGDFVQMGGVPYTDASGSLRVSGFNKDKQMITVSVGNPSHPTLTTISEIESGDFLGKLVKLNEVQFSGSEAGKTYADPLSDPPQSMNRYLEDCSSNNIIVRSSGYSTFAGDPLPEGNGTITGIVTKFNSDLQIIIRDINEVDMTGERCAQALGTLGSPVETLSEDFEGFADYDNIVVDGWQSMIVKGGRYWIAQEFDNNLYMQASGYNSGVDEMETWVITQPITISAQKVLTFRSAMAYWEHDPGNDPFELLFSTDYNGTNMGSATWTPLSAVLADDNNSNYEWVASGNINLPIQSGASGVIAFKYSGSNSESTSFIIDDVVVSAAK